MGDPLAANEATALIDDLCAAGYNIVNVDYALVPDEHFPVPLIQANQAFSYIMKHSEEYHLNMDKVILMGSSAGAIMSCQMGAVITTPEYAELLGISPALAPEQVCAIVADDAPLDYESFTLACKFLVGNYVKGSIFLNKDELNRYDCIPHMTSDYPPSIMLGSEYRYDMNEMHEKLNSLGVRKRPVSCALQFFKGGVACVHLIKCFACRLHILPICPIRQALRLLKFLRCCADNSRCRAVRHLVFVTLDTLSDLLALVEVTQRFGSRHLRPRIALLLLRKHKFQVYFVVGIVVHQYPEISALCKEILKVLADLDNLVNGSFKLFFP